MSDPLHTARSRAPGAFWGILALGLALGSALTACDGETEPAEPVPLPDAGEPTRDAGAAPEDAGPPVDASTAGGWIELGTGARRFETLEAGQEVPIIMGIQGGFHVWGGFRGAGFPDDDVRLRFWLELDGEDIARADYFEFGLPRDRADPDLYAYAGVSVVYDSNDTVEPTSGRTMTLRVEVTADDGQVMRDSLEIVPICCE